MNVRLIWVTPDAEKILGYIARVSNPDNQDNPSVEGLLRYMLKHNHWSPFEMADMCVEVETSLAIGRQILRHWSFSFQEFSNRYANGPQELGFEPIELRKQSAKNRQSSSEVFSPTIFCPVELENDDAIEIIDLHLQNAWTIYDELIDKGVAKECARMILPACTRTRMYMKGSVRDWIHYLNLRTAEDTQKEHRDIARSIQKIFIEQFPIISKALEWTS